MAARKTTRTTKGRAKGARRKAAAPSGDFQKQWKRLREQARVVGKKFAKRAEQVRKQAEAGFEDLAKEVKKEAKTFPGRFDEEMKVVRADAAAFGKDLKTGWQRVEKEVDAGLKKASQGLTKWVERVRNRGP